MSSTYTFGELGEGASQDPCFDQEGSKTDTYTDTCDQNTHTNQHVQKIQKTHKRGHSFSPLLSVEDADASMNSPELPRPVAGMHSSLRNDARKGHARARSEDVRLLQVLREITKAVPLPPLSDRKKRVHVEVPSLQVPEPDLSDVESGLLDEPPPHPSSHLGFLNPRRVMSAPELSRLSTLLHGSGHDGFGTVKGLIGAIAAALLAACMWNFEQLEASGRLEWGVWESVQLLGPLVALAWVVLTM
eukprot:comp11640_c0_seq1/m.6144 comp11640_c0_seq1/g.6144  ORF comp11640_c0_seq1/g.6144 comp11640_c0_seq1/m.6144 type:complete len:245 (-) comp11640_c0_seq1:333-1067(-)